MNTDSMIEEKEQLGRDLDKRLEAEHQYEIDKEHHRMSVESRIDNINKLVGVEYDTDQQYNYQEFKHVMQVLYQCRFERSYLRRLYRKYKSNYKAKQ